MTCTGDWECIADLPDKCSYPDFIKRTHLRQEIVLRSEAAKTMCLIELTVPYECWIKEVYHLKTEKYTGFVKELMASKLKTKVYAVYAV